MAQVATEQISTRDWEATPIPVQKVLLLLERERNALLERLERTKEANTDAHKLRLRRYQELIEQQFLTGLTPDEKQEIERLGGEIDAINSAFYPSLSSLSEIISAHTEKREE